MHTMRGRVAAILALSALLTGCGLQEGLAQHAGGTSAAPTAAPAINGSTVDGQRFSWSSVAGHVVVLDFWASWCGPCRAEQADLNALASRYAARGAVFLGVDMRDDDASARAFRKTYTVTYTSVSDADQTVAAAYDVAAPPTIVVVDQQGTIVHRYLGTVVGVSDDLDRLL